MREKQAFGEVRAQARRAWFCALSLVGLEVILGLAVRIIEQSLLSRDWTSSDWTSLDIKLRLVRSALWLLICYFFSSSGSVRAFARSLCGKWSFTGLLCVWVAMCVGLMNVYGVVKGWTPGTSWLRGVYVEGGKNLTFYIADLVAVGPVVEEVIYRGFMYPAFRQRSGIVAATLSVLAIAATFHWGAMARSGYAACCLLVLWLLLCLIREHTGNVWNCMFAHAAYNGLVATPTRLWVPLFIVVSVLYVAAWRSGRTKRVTV